MTKSHHKDTDTGTDAGTGTDPDAGTVTDAATAPAAARLNPSQKGPVPFARCWLVVKRPPVWGGRRPFFTRWGKCNAC